MVNHAGEAPWCFYRVPRLAIGTESQCETRPCAGCGCLLRCASGQGGQEPCAVSGFPAQWLPCARRGVQRKAASTTAEVAGRAADCSRCGGSL